tara:strand:+ start:96 stop:395 length:300 start_codon:yes stop_codon:yes gene_type:complete
LREEPLEEPPEERWDPRDERPCEPRELPSDDRDDPREVLLRGDTVRVETFGLEELPPPAAKISCSRAWMAGALVEVMISMDWTLRASTISTSCCTSLNN